MTALIQVDDLHYRSSSLPQGTPDILRGISLEVQQGSFTVIIGENGSGKTTLINHLNGLLLPTQGHVLVAGLDTLMPENRNKLREMTGMVFQNPADQIVASTVEEDIAFGLENLNLPTQIIRTRVEEQIRQVGLIGEQNRPPHLLSGGQIQKLALAGVLARQPRIILFDEPTSMLDAHTRESFLKRICQLHNQGTTIVYITHHMEEALLADQVLVMHQGKIALQGSPADIFVEGNRLREIGLEMPAALILSTGFHALGWDIKPGLNTIDVILSALPAYHAASSAPAEIRRPESRTVEDALIRIKAVEYIYLSDSPLAKQALNGVDLEVESGAIHALAGANGSGKSTLLQHLNGILRPSAGEVHVGPYLLEDSDTRLRDVIQMVGLVFQTPESQFFEIYVGDEIAYGPKQFEMEALRERVMTAMRMVGLDFDAYKDRRLETLSGGEKRKVALASTLILDQDILLFDEPTAGMDPQAREELLQLFRTLSQQGKTIVIASHRLEELALIAQDLTRMYAGKDLETGPIHQVFCHMDALKNSGLIAPLSVRIGQRLGQLGWPITSKDALTPHQLLEKLQELTR